MFMSLVITEKLDIKKITTPRFIDVNENNCVFVTTEKISLNLCRRRT